MKQLRPTVVDFMVYKEYKVHFEFNFRTIMINFRTQDFTQFLSSPLYHLLLCFHKDYPKTNSSLYPSWAFDYTLSYQLLAAFEIHSGILYIREIISKDDIPILLLCLNDCFFKLLFHSHKVSKGYIQLLCFL